MEKVLRTHAIISCPNGREILIRYSNKKEVEEAIVRAELKKRNEGTSEDYTAIRFTKNRSFRIEKMPPEEVIKCSVREIPVSAREREVAPNYFR